MSRNFLWRSVVCCCCVLVQNNFHMGGRLRVMVIKSASFFQRTFIFHTPAIWPFFLFLDDSWFFCEGVVIVVVVLLFKRKGIIFFTARFYSYPPPPLYDFFLFFRRLMIYLEGAVVCCRRVLVKNDFYKGRQAEAQGFKKCIIFSTHVFFYSLPCMTIFFCFVDNSWLFCECAVICGYGGVVQNDSPICRQARLTVIKNALFFQRTFFIAYPSPLYNDFF